MLFINLTDTTNQKSIIDTYTKKREKNPNMGNSLVVQWLALIAFTAGTQVQSLVRELRSCKPHGMAEKEKKDTGSLNGYKNKTHIYAVYKRPISDLGTHTD